jgi:hypothetical protein
MKDRFPFQLGFLGGRFLDKLKLTRAYHQSICAAMTLRITILSITTLSCKDTQHNDT